MPLMSTEPKELNVTLGLAVTVGVLIQSVAGRDKGKEATRQRREEKSARGVGGGGVHPQHFRRTMTSLPVLVAGRKRP